MSIVVTKNVTSGEMPIVIPDGAVTNSKIADGAVTSVKLGSGAVTTGKINNNAVTSAKINLTHSAETNNWTKLPISSKVVIHMLSGTVTNETWSGNTWKSVWLSNKPADLNTSHTFFGVVTGKPTDNAINLSGHVSQSNGDVYFQSYNAYSSSVTCNIEWTAIVIELLA